MNMVLICIAAFLTALLTFFSGFGLGTILLPVFAIFFPVEIAVALVGVVHLVNNLFKVTLVGKNTDRQVLLKFGIPAILASLAGAWLLLRISGLPALVKYSIGDKDFEITPVKLVISVLLIVFSLFEIIPSQEKEKGRFASNSLPLGGILSGFFGGLAGIQGAIRSAFLIRSGLSKEGYIATGVVIACLVDLTRLPVYFSRFMASELDQNLVLVFSATVAAMGGSLIGRKFLPKLKFRSIQILVTVLLIVVSIALGTGII